MWPKFRSLISRARCFVSDLANWRSGHISVVLIQESLTGGLEIHLKCYSQRGGVSRWALAAPGYKKFPLSSGRSVCPPEDARTASLLELPSVANAKLSGGSACQVLAWQAGSTARALG